MLQGIREFESHTFRQRSMRVGEFGFDLGLRRFHLKSRLHLRTRLRWALHFVLWRVIASLLLLVAMPVRSEFAPLAPAAQDLKVLLRNALERYPSIAARRQEFAAAQGAVDSARWQRYPSLSVSGVGLGSNGAAPSTVSVQQILWAGGRIEGGIAAADSRMAAAAAGTLVEEQTVLEKTVAAYTELQRQQARLVASEENVRRHTDLYGLIARRVGQEVSSAADSALATARLAQARAERQQISAAIGNARAALQSLSGEVVRVVVSFEAPSPGFASVQEALAAAENFSPEIARQRSLAAAATSDIDVRKGQLLPTLAARVEHLRNPIIGVHSSTDRALLAFEFQPGAGLSALSAVREAEARRLAAISAVEGSRLELEQKLNAAWIDAQSSAIQREPLRILARTNVAIVDSFLRQYRVGRKSWLDVLNAQREAVQALYALADVESQALAGALRVRIVTGALSADTLEALILNPLSALKPTAPIIDSSTDLTPPVPMPDQPPIPRMTR
jgi:adhesin transport system outer membrane protein